uniref:Haloacid dehalogenase-like hydrolase family protein n=1 Tax=Kalanchoe fedtschenkoi TaxID=63787 RepID=A0A7N0V739_KALFE
MLPRILRPSSAVAMAGVISQAAAAPLRHRLGSKSAALVPQTVRCIATASSLNSLGFRMRFGVSRSGELNGRRRIGLVCAAERGYRKVRMRAPKKSRGKELELNVDICIEDELPDDHEIVNIAELLRLNAPVAMKEAFCSLQDSKYKTRDTSIEDVGGFESVELSVMLCNDEFIRKLNLEWRGEDHPTDVLSMSQHIAGVKLPILMLGDIVISVETAARQAEERGHTLLDEIRILLVHGLLHLLGFDHELSVEAEEEMEKEEEVLLTKLGWKGKGLIKSACEAVAKASPPESSGDRKTDGSIRFRRPKFSYIFCDMDGTLLNSKSLISSTTAEALKEAASRGIKVVIATGKARHAAKRVLEIVGLTGKGGIFSDYSPGVFVQGLLVYGRNGQQIFRQDLDPSICREAFIYSRDHGVPLIAFCEDRCLSLFDHPLLDSLHTVYHEAKAEIITSVEQLAAAGAQKLIFLDTAESVATTLRPYWSAATGDRATVVQAVPDMLEIVPPGTSKGSGVRMLLDHLGVSEKEVMAIGDGENDVEMLQLASLGVALSNGSEKAKAVANVIGVSNDEDGVADAIYRYAF